jgi:hypothetical protein
MPKKSRKTRMTIKPKSSKEIKPVVVNNMEGMKSYHIGCQHNVMKAQLPPKIREKDIFDMMGGNKSQKRRGCV